MVFLDTSLYNWAQNQIFCIILAGLWKAVSPLSFRISGGVINSIDKRVCFRVFSFLYRRPLGRDLLLYWFTRRDYWAWKVNSNSLIWVTASSFIHIVCRKVYEFVCTRLVKIHVSDHREIREHSKLSGAFPLKIRAIQPSAGTKLSILKVCRRFCRSWGRTRSVSEEGNMHGNLLFPLKIMEILTSFFQ